MILYVATFCVVQLCFHGLTTAQDLEEELDDLIADVKTRMEKACEIDNEAVSNFQPAVHKVKMLPEVMGLLNRQNIQHAVLDPETNFLQSVKFFLEPLSNDGQLPAYNIQREIFTALTKLQIEKEALLSSGIGRIVLFYTKTKRAQPEIKRMAERLMGEWSRPILKRTDDYKKRMIESRVVDPRYVVTFPGTTISSSPNTHLPATSANQQTLPNPQASSTAPPPPSNKKAPTPASPPPSPSAAQSSSSPSSTTPTAPAPPARRSRTPSRPSATATLRLTPPPCSTTGLWGLLVPRRLGR